MSDKEGRKGLLGRLHHEAPSVSQALAPTAENIIIKIATDFTKAPGPRFEATGSGVFSGEEFRNRILSCRYREAKEKGVKLEVDIDGTLGYMEGFLEEAFGGLVRQLKGENILDVLHIVSSDKNNPYIKRIESYVSDAVDVAKEKKGLAKLFNR